MALCHFPVLVKGWSPHDNSLPADADRYAQKFLGTDLHWSSATYFPSKQLIFRSPCSHWFACIVLQSQVSGLPKNLDVKPVQVRGLMTEVLANQAMAGWQRHLQSTQQDSIKLSGLVLSDGTEKPDTADDWDEWSRQKVLLRFSFWYPCQLTEGCSCWHVERCRQGIKARATAPTPRSCSSVVAAGRQFYKRNSWEIHFSFSMDELSYLRVNFTTGKGPAWSWQDFAQMQWCENTALSLPGTQQWCSPVHSAPTLLSQPCWLHSWLRVRNAASWVAHFCIAAWELTWHPGNEHPRNGGAETLSGQKKKTIWFVTIHGIQPLIIVCNGELKSIKTKHWGGHWLSLFITTFPSAVACALSWQRQFPATQELATQRTETRGRPR